jgi:hypothetical protein
MSSIIQPELWMFFGQCHSGRLKHQALRSELESSFSASAVMSDWHKNLPTAFPSLPPSQSGQGWPLNYLTAYQIISETYNHAIQILHQDDYKTSCIGFYINAITSDALPLLEALETEGGSTAESLPSAWLQSSAIVLGWVVQALTSYREEAQQ